MTCLLKLKQVQNKDQKGYNVPDAKLQSQSHDPEKNQCIVKSLGNFNVLKSKL